MDKSIIIRGGIRLFLSASFLLSGIIKVLDPARFHLDVESFQLLSPLAAYLTALALPWFEIFTALGLWIPKAARGSALLASTITSVFILALLMTQHLDLDCGCFGDWLIFPNLATHIAFNCALLASGIYLTCRPAHKRS